MDEERCVLCGDLRSADRPALCRARNDGLHAYSSDEAEKPDWSITREEIEAWILKECSWGRIRSRCIDTTETKIQLAIRGRYLTPERQVTRSGVAFIQRYLKTNIGPNVLL